MATVGDPKAFSNETTHLLHGLSRTAVFARDKLVPESHTPTDDMGPEIVVVIVQDIGPLLSKAPEPCVARSRNYWEMYVELIEKYPLHVKTATATILFLFADTIAQGLEYINTNQTEVFDGMRSLRFAAFGLFGAPWSHYYFGYLDRILPPTESPWTLRTLLKLVIDQFFQAPVLLAIMIASLSFMEGKGLSKVELDLNSDFLPTLFANCTSRMYAC